MERAGIERKPRLEACWESKFLRSALIVRLEARHLEKRPVRRRSGWSQRVASMVLSRAFGSASGFGEWGL
jgi:hypothetical protein